MEEGAFGDGSVHLHVSPPAVWKCVGASGVGFQASTGVSSQASVPVSNFSARLRLLAQ